MKISLHSLTKQMRGVTLIELMLALVISSILLLGVGTLYGNARRTYNIDEEFARMQENARFAMKFLVEDIRMAGYMGCVLNDNTTPEKFVCFLNDADTYACSNRVAGLEGYEATSTSGGGTLTAVTSPPRLDNGVAGDWTNVAVASLPEPFPIGTRPPVAGSDIIIVHHGNQKGGKLTAIGTNNLTVADPTTAGLTDNCHTPSEICANDIVIVNDCAKARIFQATALTAPGDINIAHDTGSAPGNKSPTVWDTTSANFSTNDSEVMKYHTYAYYVANNAAGQPALFRHDGINGTAAAEMVEGIENMQILYGLDTDNPRDGIANRYASANTVDFRDAAPFPIVSVRISILVRSRENIPNRQAAANDFQLSNTKITNVSDQRLRKVFTTTIKIRNKGLISPP